MDKVERYKELHKQMQQLIRAGDHGEALDDITDEMSGIYGEMTEEEQKATHTCFAGFDKFMEDGCKSLLEL